MRRGRGRGRDPARLPAAVARAPPGPQPGRPGRRRALPRRGAAPSRCSPTRSAAPPTTAASWPRRRWRRRAEVGFEGFDFSARGARRAAWASASSSTPVRAAGPDGDAARGRGPRAGDAPELRGVAARAPRAASTSCASRPARPARGAGEVAFGPVPCPRCRGTGQRARQPRPHDLLARRARDCGGTGALRRRPCAALRRRGARARERVARGADPARRRRRQRRSACPGCGNAGPPRRPARRLRPAPSRSSRTRVFRREGDDLHCVVPVGMVEAALGGHVEVPTPDGPVTIEVPPGTQTGQRFRLRKRGVPQPGRRRARRPLGRGAGGDPGRHRRPRRGRCCGSWPRHPESPRS